MAVLVREGRVVITPGRGARLWGWEIGYGGYSCQLYAGQLGHVVVFVGIGAKFGKWGADLAKCTRSSARSLGPKPFPR